MLRIMSNVYVVYSGGYFKIGKTNEFRKRLSAIKTYCPMPISAYAVLKTVEADRIEKELHSVHSKIKSNGEWFTGLLNLPKLKEYGSWEWTFIESGPLGKPTTPTIFLLNTLAKSGIEQGLIKNGEEFTNIFLTWLDSLSEGRAVLQKVGKNYYNEAPAVIRKYIN